MLRCLVVGQIPCTPLLFAKYLVGMLVGVVLYPLVWCVYGLLCCFDVPSVDWVGGYGMFTSWCMQVLGCEVG